MFKLFKKSAAEKLEIAYRKKLEEAQAAQRAGKMPLFATLSSEAEEIGRQLDDARAAASHS